MLLAVSLSVALVAYNTLFNLRLPLERWYVPANLLAAATITAVARRAGLSWADLGLTRWVSGLGWGLALAVAVAVTIWLVVRFAGATRVGRRVLADRRADVSRDEIAYQTLVRIPFGTALFEEVAFRGVLLAAFSVPLSRTSAVIVSSLVFGVWHVAPTIEALYLNRIRRSSRVALGVVAAVGLTSVGGIALCILRFLSGGVLACVLAHWTVNSLGIFAAYLAQRRRPDLVA